MAYRRDAFEFGETYHCYSRGVDKRIVFQDAVDYKRFIQALYLCNDTDPVRRHEMERISHEEVFQESRKEQLVSIVAYSLMPNHFHLLLTEMSDHGIRAFMRKLGTAYTMYFNIKNERIGNLFVKPFRSKRIMRDSHYLHIPHYIHLNAAPLFEPGWEQGKVGDIPSLEKKLKEYPFSSFPEYCGIMRPESVVIDERAMSDWYENQDPPSRVIKEAIAYHSSLTWQ